MARQILWRRGVEGGEMGGRGSLEGLGGLEGFGSWEVWNVEKSAAEVGVLCR